MVRTVKSSDKSATSASTTTSSTAKTAVPVVETASTTTTTKPRAKKAKVEPVVTSVTTTASDENTLTTATTTTVVAANDVSALPTKMSEFSAKLQQLISLFSTVKNDFKTLEKHVNREVKNAIKLSSKKRKSNGNRKPSGFVKPTLISDELANFLGKTVGTEMARTEVSREINAYIQANKLQDKSNGRKINPDAKLKTLLRLNTEDELTYFNLQRYMKPHFIKTVVLENAVVSSNVV